MMLDKMMAKINDEVLDYVSGNVYDLLHNACNELFITELEEALAETTENADREEYIEIITSLLERYSADVWGEIDSTHPLFALLDYDEIMECVVWDLYKEVKEIYNL